ncbi:hypothetical protein CRYUN_Cryun32bG0053600 [Craigia yunnanensis]
MEKGSIFTVFVNNIPSKVHWRWLWRTFQHHGEILDVFIPRKRSKMGRMIGLARIWQDSKGGQIIGENYFKLEGTIQVRQNQLELFIKKNLPNQNYIEEENLRFVKKGEKKSYVKALMSEDEVAPIKNGSSIANITLSSKDGNQNVTFSYVPKELNIEILNRSVVGVIRFPDSINSINIQLL